MYCPICGARNDEDARFCIHCRADLTEARKAAAEGSDSPMAVPDPARVARPSHPSATSIAATVVVFLVLAAAAWWALSGGGASRVAGIASGIWNPQPPIAPTAAPQRPAALGNSSAGTPASPVSTPASAAPAPTVAPNVATQGGSLATAVAAPSPLPVAPTAVPPAPTVSATPTPMDVARTTVQEANLVWASVVAQNGAPIEELDQVYGGAWLAEVKASIEAMRAKGQYRVARMTAPIVVRSAQQVSESRIEAFVSEEWDDRVYNADGSLVQVVPGHVEQRYVLERSGDHWLIVESQITRSQG